MAGLDQGHGQFLPDQTGTQQQLQTDAGGQRHVAVGAWRQVLMASTCSGKWAVRPSVGSEDRKEVLEV